MAIYLPEITVKHIDWLTVQAQNGLHDRCWINELRQTVLQQQKNLRIFFLTVDALGKQYQERYQHYDQLSRQLKLELSDHNDTVQSDEQLSKHDEELLGFLEQQLHYWRTFATQQRDKKTKREQQYHQACFLPVVSTHYQKRYIQARDKNNQVEQQLSDLHYALDFVKYRIKQHRRTLTARLKYHQTLGERQQQLGAEMGKIQCLMDDMKQAQSFWCQFDTQYIQPYLDLLLCHEDRECEEINSNSCRNNFHGVWWARIRQSTLDYERAQHHGLLHYWGHHVTWDIYFTCTRCRELTQRWPYLDKQTAQLLCTSCYHYTQVKKSTKESPLPMNNTQSQPGQKSPSSTVLPTNSTLYMPSSLSSTTKSVHNFLNECKPFVKKMKTTLALNSKLDLLTSHPILVSKYLYRSLLP